MRRMSWDIQMEFLGGGGESRRGKTKRNTCGHFTFTVNKKNTRTRGRQSLTHWESICKSLDAFSV